MIVLKVCQYKGSGDTVEVTASPSGLEDPKCDFMLIDSHQKDGVIDWRGKSAKWHQQEWEVESAVYANYMMSQQFQSTGSVQFHTFSQQGVSTNIPLHWDPDLLNVRMKKKIPPIY